MAEVSAPTYRLRGAVGGAQRSFLLAPGDNRVGSRADNALVLPVAGVSRRHALLHLEGETVTLRDLDSKNGVRVDGVVQREAILRAGQRIRFGPVELTLERIDPADARLAIALDRGDGETGPPQDDTRTVGLTDPAGSARLLERLADLADHLVTTPPATEEALAILAGEVGAEGLLLLRGGGASPAVAASWGRVEPLLGARVLDEVVAELADGSSHLVSRPLDDAVVMVGRRRDRDEAGELLALLALGARRDAGGYRLLVAALRLLESLVIEGAPTGDRPARGRDELVFPAGYVQGRSPAMEVVYDELISVADTELPVLLVGETGVGKELLARTLHLSSRRREGPFLAVNCAAIPSELLEAEMFGIERGVATGVEARGGRFALADGGTLFLDEVGELEPPLQAKLLRALEEGEIQPVGGSPVDVDVRLVSATNADLGEAMEAGRFRRDLFFRLAGATVHLPPLRQRREDIPPLVAHFVRSAATEAAKEIRGVTVGALERLMEHPWPGNVRQLANQVRRLVHLCPPGEAIDSGLLPSEPSAAAGGLLPGDVADLESLELDVHLERLERRLVEEALRRTGGNRTRAAELLGISRNGLAAKIERLGLDG